MLAGKAGATDAAVVRDDAHLAMEAIRAYEQSLSLELLRVLNDCGAQIYGISDHARMADRVPTFCFNMPGVLPADVTDAAARAGIGIRDGHMYAPRLMKRLNLTKESGAVRASLVHYNTTAEIHRFGNVLAGLRGRR
jgi:selenocysteine lyase/cysteine desulfurase